MAKEKGVFLGLLFVVTLAFIMALVIACGGAQATPTKAPLATAAPTAAPAPTTAPAPTPEAAQPVYGGTLRFAHRFHIETLDPAHNVLGGAYQEFYAIYDKLLTIDQVGNVLPALARSWDISADGKTITFRLQEGVKFHDGTDFNAQAVKAHFDRLMDPSEISPRAGELKPYVESLQVVDNHTLNFKLFNPFRPLLAQLATERFGFLTSPAAVAKYGGGKEGNYGRNPVGTGPFVFKEWVPDSHILLTRNESYWQRGLPYLDAIRVQGVKDPSVRISMLRTGETDIVYNGDFRPAEVPLVEGNPNLKVVALQGASTSFLQFNSSKPPFDNKALRQAIGYAIDRENFIRAVYAGHGVPAYTLIATGWAYNPDIKPVTFDLNKAKVKLAEAGYASGATIPMGCQPSGEYSDMCEVTQQMVKEIGITIEIKPMETTTYFAMTDAGYYMRWGFGTTKWFHRVDPHLLNFFNFHSKGFNNVGTYVNPEVDRLIDEAATIYEPAKAKELYDKIQATVAAEAPAVFIARLPSYTPMSKKVQNFIPYVTNFEHLEFLWLEK